MTVFSLKKRTNERMNEWMNEWMNRSWWNLARNCCCTEYTGLGLYGIRPRKMAISVENCKFSHHRVFNAPANRLDLHTCRQILPTFVADTIKKSSATQKIISPNCRPILFDGRPITASVTEVSHAHPPSTCPLACFDWHVFDKNVVDDISWRQI